VKLKYSKIYPQWNIWAIASPQNRVRTCAHGKEERYTIVAAQCGTITEPKRLVLRLGNPTRLIVIGKREGANEA